MSALSELVRVEDIPVVRGVESFDAFFRREYRAVLGLATELTRSRPVAENLSTDISCEQAPADVERQARSVD